MLSGVLVAASIQAPQFKSRVAAVRVDALVTDGRRPITGLTAANFELRDNGSVQNITDLHHETLPLNIICGARRERQRRGRTARAAQARLPGRDRRPRSRRSCRALNLCSRASSLHTSFTSDRDRLRALADGVDTGGTTSLFDAVFSALALREADERRTLLLLFTDGRDTSSWLTAQKLVAPRRRTDVVIYPVTIRSLSSFVTLHGSGFMGRRAAQEPSERLLDTLADDTGGRVVYASDESALESTFLSVLRGVPATLRAQLHT